MSINTTQQYILHDWAEYKIVDYKILSRNYAKYLEEDTMGFLNDGYELHGSPFISKVDSATLYNQAVIKREIKEQSE